MNRQPHDRHPTLRIPAPAASIHLALICIAVALAPTPAAGQPQAAQPAPAGPPHEDRVDIFEVLVPVNVVGRDGEPVRGLTAEDFDLRIDGRRQQIRHFEVVDLEILQPEAGRDAGAPELIPAGGRRLFLLLFDLSFSTPGSILRARSAARELALEHLHPSDLVAVATVSLETGPRLVLTFTPDRAQVARAIETLGISRLVDSPHRVDPLQFILEDPGRAGAASLGVIAGEGTEGRVGPQEQALLTHLNIVQRQIDRSEAFYARGRVSSWVNALQGLGQVLGSIQGRKHVLYFSEGFDGRLLLGRGGDTEDPAAVQDRLALEVGAYWMVDTDDLYGNTGLQNEVGRMLDEFRRADAVVHAVDISGLRADFADEARARSAGQDVLFYVANETGGELFDDANDLGRELVRVLSRSQVTYLLTVAPSRLKEPGAFHRIQVRSGLPRGTRVSHRTGFYAPRPFDELHPLEKSLLAAAPIARAESRREIALEVLATPFHAGGGRAYVPVILEARGGDLLRDHTGSELVAEIFAYVSDARDEMRDFFTQRITLDLTQARAALAASGLKYYGHLELPPGDYLLRTLVRNADTGRAGVRSLRLSVPDYDRSEPDLLTPLFFEPPGTWLLVRDQAADGEAASVVYPFTIKGEPFVPAAQPVVQRGSRHDLCLVAYNLDEGGLDLEATVVDAEGNEVPGGRLELLERTVTGIRGQDKLLASFRWRGAARGELMLRVELRDAGGRRLISSIPFRAVGASGG